MGTDIEVGTGSGLSEAELRAAPLSALEPDDQLAKKALREKDAERARQVRYSRFISPRIRAYMAEWPFPGPHSTPSWWVTLKPKFPDWQEPKKMDALWRPREPEGMAPFEVYRGHHFCGAVTRWESGQWLAWRAPEEVEEFPSAVGGRMTGSLLAVRRTRSRAVRALLDFQASGVEPEHDDSPSPERFPGRQAVLHFVAAVEATLDRVEGYWRRGQAFFNVLYDIRPEWADEIRGSDKDPFSDDRRIGEFLALVRGKFHAEALVLEQDLIEWEAGGR